MIVVADTGPLNYLVVIGEVHILGVLYSRVAVPAAVAAELCRPQAPPDVRAWIATPPSWLNILPDPLPNPAFVTLDAGEAAAIALA